MSDILDDFREWQADRQRWARDRTHSDRCHMHHDECMVVRMAAEIARLRLTDAEMEALKWCQRNIAAMAPPLSAFEQVQAATLRGFLARHGGAR